MKKWFAMLLTFSLCVSFAVCAWAEEHHKNDVSPDNDYLETDTLILGEGELIARMIQEGSLTYEDLNAELAELAALSATELKELGYEREQIGKIRSYTKELDAFSYLYGSETESEAPTLTFRYGLAGTANTKRGVRIIYDARWSQRPMFRYTDSLALRWNVSNAEGIPLCTKIDNEVGIIVYGSDSTAEVVKEAVEGTFSNYLILRFPMMRGKLYAKIISGVLDISTQSDSYNMEFIELCVAYAHGIKQAKNHTNEVVPSGQSFSLKDKKNTAWLIKPTTMLIPATDYNGSYVYQTVGTE